MWAARAAQRAARNFSGLLFRTVTYKKIGPTTRTSNGNSKTQSLKLHGCPRQSCHHRLLFLRRHFGTEQFKRHISEDWGTQIHFTHSRVRDTWRALVSVESTF